MTLLGESFPNEQYQIGSEQFRQARRHEDVWGAAERAPPILFCFMVYSIFL